jgi:hypothetical protein
MARPIAPRFEITVLKDKSSGDNTQIPANDASIQFYRASSKGGYIDNPAQGPDRKICGRRKISAGGEALSAQRSIAHPDEPLRQRWGLATDPWCLLAHFQIPKLDAVQRGRVESCQE